MKAKILILLTSLIMIATCLSLSGCSMCDHVFEDVKIIKPTCTKMGYTIRTCSLCSMTVTDTYVSSTGHIYSGDGVVIEPNCTQGGYTQFECASCGEDVQSDFKEPLGHNFSIRNEIKAPTCNEKGFAEYSCSRCGTCKEVIEDELGHDYVPVSETDGITLSICSRCGNEVEGSITYTITYYLDGGKANNPTEYNLSTETFTLNSPVKEGSIFLGWTWDGQDEPVTKVTIQKGSYGNRVYYANWFSGECTYHVLNGEYVTTEYIDSSTPGLVEYANGKATCTKTGMGVYTCEACNNEIFTLTKKDHSFDTNNVKEYIVKPTCDQPGRGRIFCSVCGQTIESEIPATGHNYDSELITQGNKAYIKSSCKTCGKQVEGLVDKCSDYIPATCSKEGSITYVFVTSNGEVLSATLVIQKTAHVLNGECVGESVNVDIKGVTEYVGMFSTCVKSGGGKFICENCNYEIFTITHRDHALQEGTIVVVEQATCDKTGKVRGFCQECQATVVNIIPALGHDCTYTVTAEASQTEVGKVIISCEIKDCGFEIECYLPKLTDEGYQKTTLAGGRVQYSYKFYEYGITVTFIK